MNLKNTEITADTVQFEARADTFFWRSRKRRMFHRPTRRFFPTAGEALEFLRTFTPSEGGEFTYGVVNRIRKSERHGRVEPVLDFVASGTGEEWHAFAAPVGSPA